MFFILQSIIIKMMQSGWMSKQFNSSKQISKIKINLQEIKNQNNPRLLEHILTILNFFLGSSDNNGILYRFGKEFSEYQSIQWASQLQKLLQHIGPQSIVFAQILKCNRDPNFQMTISSSYFPSYFDPNLSDKGRLLSLRTTHLGICLPPLDAFYVMLASAIYNSQAILPPTTKYQHLFLDEFFTSLSRNPLLVLLRHNIQHFNIADKNVLQKIILILRIFFVDEVLIKYEQDRIKNGDKSFQSQSMDYSNTMSLSTIRDIQLKYRLKVHHIHTIYFALKYGVQYLAADFPKYMQSLVEYFGSLKPDQYSLQAIIRVWIYGMSAKNENNIQNEVIRALKNANSKSGWFKLKRYKLSSISVKNNLSSFNIQTALSILKLLDKQSNWTANPSYLFAFACFFRFLECEKIFFSQFSNLRKINDSKYDNLVEKVMKVIINRFNQEMVESMSLIKRTNPKDFNDAINLVQSHQEVISSYVAQYMKSKQLSRTWKSSKIQMPTATLLRQFTFKPIKQIDLITVEKKLAIRTSDVVDHDNTEGKKNLVTFYRSQPRGCWEVPIQYNQSAILYYSLFIIAKIIDLIIPGKRQYPFLNLRVLANPINFFGFLLVIFVAVLLFK